MTESEYRLQVRSELDVTRTILQAKKCAATVGFNLTSQTLLATAVSELARNILKYAKVGEVIIRTVEKKGREGMEVVARDSGPGIADIEAALSDHVSTGGTLGLGLPGVKRMMDELEIESEVNRGTVVTIRKWLK